MSRCIPFIVFLSINTITSAQQLELLWKTDTLLRVPESVYYDDKRNELFVSNINGKSSEKDGNGFISRVSTDGKIIARDWVTGLDAPKGMARLGDLLYVADLAQVAVIDVEQGEIVNRLTVDGAQFLNDVTADKKGIIYLSDSNTGKIHRISKNKVELYFEGKDFKRINGLLSVDDGLYIADAGSGIHYILSKDKQLKKYAETAQGADGIVHTGKNEYIVSSWAGEVYFVDKEANAKKMLDTKEQKVNSADIGFDAKTQTLFVPTFNAHTVMAYRFTR